MKKVYLLRHAKAQDGADDKARALAVQGIVDVKNLQQTLAGKSFAPEMILCSTARRTRQTLENLQEDSFFEEAKTVYEDAIYIASAQDLLAILKKQEDAISSVLLIGHNPSMHELAIALIGSGADALVRDVAAHFPPCSFVEFTFTIGTWNEINVATGQLEQFIYPKR